MHPRFPDLSLANQRASAVVLRLIVAPGRVQPRGNHIAGLPGGNLDLDPANESRADHVAGEVLDPPGQVGGIANAPGHERPIRQALVDTESRVVAILDDLTFDIGALRTAKR